MFPLLITTGNSSTEANFTRQYLKLTKLSYKHWEPSVKQTSSVRSGLYFSKTK